MININNSATTSIYLGQNLVQKIYTGNELIYSASTPAVFQGLSIISGSVSGSGTLESPYLVASDTSPSPVYTANVPGLLTVSFTNRRFFDYNCGKGGCDQGRHNEAVFFNMPEGLSTFYEQFRTNFDFNSNGAEPWFRDFTLASKNTITTISYPMYTGQRMSMRQMGVGDGNRQLTNARISFQPLNDPNFSISYVGSRAVIGDGSPLNPYVSTESWGDSRNQRTYSFRANGNGIVAVIGMNYGMKSNLLYGTIPFVYVGGSANSFSGSVGLTHRDFFGWGDLGWANKRVNFFRVTDGQIFSFASIASDKGGTWIEETQQPFGKLAVCRVPNSTSENSLNLLNVNPFASQQVSSTSQMIHQRANTWSGLGTASSPANMNSFLSDTGPNALQNLSSVYSCLNGTITFNYQINSGGIRVVRNIMPCRAAHGAYQGDDDRGVLTSSSGSASYVVNAWNGLHFNREGNASFRITNLVFTPSA